MQNNKHSEVQEYYGKTLKQTSDLQTNCCLSEPTWTKSQRKILSEISPEIISKSYGCGCPIPPLISGISLLDIGCGTGRDCFLASALAGESGSVVGVDMTTEQLQVANSNIPYHVEKFQLKKPNIQFKQGVAEDLKSAGIEDSSMDVVISNCVINLSPDKSKVFQEIFRVLKEGGELYFSDVFANKRIPEHLQKDAVLWGECLSGALYYSDFQRIMKETGFLYCEETSSTPISVGNESIKNQIGDITLMSKTIRAFKISTLEKTEEDYEQWVTYMGTISDYPNEFQLDSKTKFLKGVPTRVSGNIATILSSTRYAQNFIVSAKGVHKGAFSAEGEACCSTDCCVDKNKKSVQVKKSCC